MLSICSSEYVYEQTYAATSRLALTVALPMALLRTGGPVDQVGAIPIDDSDRVFSAFLFAVCMRLYVSCFMALSWLCHGSSP